MMQQEQAVIKFPRRVDGPLKFAPRRASIGPAPMTRRTPAPVGLRFKRTRFTELTWARIFQGGRLSDFGRFGRYALVLAAGLAFAWLPAIAYIKLAKPQYVSHFSLILPGAGASSSVNLAEIGQASSASNSAYASSTISPTVTYKNLILSANVMGAAEGKLALPSGSLPVPTIKLVDETSFIGVDMWGPSPEVARDRALAVQEAFFAELTKLRDDEIKRRESSTINTVQQYEQQVNAIRERISSLQSQSGLHSLDQYGALVAATDNLKLHVAETEAALAKHTSSAKALSTTLNLSADQAALAMKLHADPQFIELADATGKAQSEFAESSQQFGSNHPKVVEARMRFDGAQAQMLARASKLTKISPQKLVGKLDLSSTGQRSALMSQLVSLETESSGLEAQLAAEKQELAAKQQVIANFVEVAAKLDSLNRDYKVAEAVFASALARVSTSKADIFASYPMVQVTEAPVRPLQPSSPNKKLALAAAAAATLLLLIAASLAWIRKALIGKLLKMPQEGA
jgi:uncharacterized protein involved in exopolysaccharide biosynthesis